MKISERRVLGAFACETGLHLPSRMWFMPN